MARRKRGNPVDGWVVVDKPLGMTSTQVVAKVRWAWRAQKAGHSGTLDPLATGALAVALGEATKTVPIAQDGAKTYEFEMRLGIATATDDGEGEAIATREHRPSDAEIKAALPAFTGDILQVPPRYSAVHVDGARAYDLARAGESPELSARPLHVAELSLIARPDADHARLRLVCAKGGYVRSIARDLGEALGCLAHVSALRRLRTGPFGLDGALDIAALDRVRETEEGPLLPVAAGLAGLPEIPVDPVAAARLRNGQAVPVTRSGLSWGDSAWASLDGAPVCLGRIGAGEIRPERVFVSAP